MIGGQEWPFEVQIRSEEMHENSEYGKAAHWDYKQLTKQAHQALPAEATPPLGGNKAVPTLAQINYEMQQVEINATHCEFTGIKSSAKKSRITSYIDALAMSRKSLVESNIFVFVSSTESSLDGRLITIDPRACGVNDVLKRFGVELNNSHKVFKNGSVARHSDILSNGDVLTLPSEFIDRVIQVCT